MKIIITGALGHIGSKLLRDPKLLSAANEIVIIDDLSTQRYISVFDLPPNVNYFFRQGDVAEHLSKNLVEDADAVVHLAGITEPSASVANPNWLYENNLRITKHVADVCAVTETPLLFVSTTSVYTSSQSMVTESCTELSPISPYAQCKLEEEAYVLDTLSDSQSLVLRLGTIFGFSPGMRFHTAVNKFCWQAVTGQQIEVWSTAMDQIRPYLSVSDASAAISKSVIDKIYPGEIVNAVSCDVTVREVLGIISDSGCALDIRMVESSLMNSFSFRTSTEKAKNLGFNFNGDMRFEINETLKLLGGVKSQSE